MAAKTKQALSLNRLIALVVAGGFLFLFVETLIEHNEVVGEEFVAWVPILFSAVGAVLALLAAIRWQGSWIRILHLYLVLALFTGVAGLFFHNEDWLLSEKSVATEIHYDNDDGDEAENQHEEEEAPPILAPAAFAGLGLVGLLGTCRRWPADVVAKNS